MTSEYFLRELIICTAFSFALLVCISIGRTVLRLKLRREENEKLRKEIELAKRKKIILKEADIVRENLDEINFTRNVRDEIEKLTR